MSIIPGRDTVERSQNFALIMGGITIAFAIFNIILVFVTNNNSKDLMAALTVASQAQIAASEAQLKASEVSNSLTETLSNSLVPRLNEIASSSEEISSEIKSLGTRFAQHADQDSSIAVNMSRQTADVSSILNKLEKIEVLETKLDTLADELDSLRTSLEEGNSVKNAQ